MRENELIRHVRSQVRDAAAVVGIGDDCCLWTPQGRTCLSTDAIVEGRHFRSDHAPALVGRKAAAAALSDLAAMGARPVGAVVALCCPARWDAAAIMDGLLGELQRHDCALLGGDTTGAEQLVITVTVWGEAHAGGRLLLRSGGAVGDILAVTGPLGGSLLRDRHLTPEPRLLEGAWLAQRSEVHALMDLSDGLASDAPTLATASGLGVVLWPHDVPVHDDVPQMSDQVRAACCDGEDYELLVAIEAQSWPALQVAWPFAFPLCAVGILVEGSGACIEDANGRLAPLPWRGYEHQ